MVSGNNKYLVGIIFASFITVLITGWVAHTHTAEYEQNNRLQTYFDNNYENILSIINGTHPKEINLDALNDSPLDVLITKQDSIVFWNNIITNEEDIALNADQYAVLYRDVQHDYTIQIGIDLALDAKFNEFIERDLHMQLVPFQEATIKAASKNIVQKPVELLAKSISSESFTGQISFLFYVLLILCVLFYLHRLIFLQKIMSPSMGLLIGFVLYSFHRFYLIGFFENTHLAQIINKGSILFPNLQEAIVLIIFIGFILTIIQRTQVMKLLPSELGNLASALIVTSGFLVFINQIKNFIHSEPLSLLHNDVLQYIWDGLFFLVVQVFFLGILFYGSLVLFRHLQPSKNNSFKYALWVVGIALTYPIGHFLDIQLPIWTIYTFIFSYLLILELYQESKEKNIIYTFWWIIIFSGFLASTTFFYRLNNSIRVQENQIQKLYSFENKDDNKQIKRIDSTFQASNIFSQLAELTYPSGLDINDYKTYILQILQDGGIDIFRSQLTLEATDQLGITLFNNHFSTSYTFTKSIVTANRLSEYIFYNPFDNAYYLRYQVENLNYTNSPFNLTLKLNLGAPTDKTEITSNYTIIKNGNLVDNNVLEISELSLKDLRNIDQSIISNDINYSVYKPTKDVKIIAFSKIGGLMKPISLFSFIVGIMGFVLFILALINTKVRFLPQDINLHLYNTSSLRTRIQMTIILLIVFSFVIIGGVTTFFFKNVLENNNNIAQKEEITSILNDIRNSIEGVETNYLAAATVQSRIDEMAHVHGKNLAFYDNFGKLMKTSFTTPKISRTPFDIVRGYATANSEHPTTRKTVKNGLYYMDFIPVYYKSQSNPYGYLGVSYRSLKNSNRSIRDFFSTILNVYIFLFLIAGVLAILVGNSITKPLSILSQKLKDFKLGKTNEALEWNTKDEIGKLIKEYNTLVEKLDESVATIARTERDEAWKEMAKQVAHEIKNPLTPMKLSVQYLEKAVKDDPSRAEELVKRVSKTLIEQINNLSLISNTFSEYAIMPKTTNEKLVINEIVENVHDLFRKRDDMDILLSEPIHDMYVFVDRNHLLRILINIIKNATQAIPNDRRGKIEIGLSKVDNMAVVSVKDNGTGIPDEMKDKVFTFKFTTKSSGSGLGLGISANMIESFNGKMYFETEVGLGTTFFIEIPLMRLDDNFPTEAERVSLD